MTELIKRERINFDPTDERHEYIKEALNLPSDQMDRFKDYFIDQNKLSRHYDISSFFFKNNIVANNAVRDFKPKYIGSMGSKLMFLESLKKQLDIQFIGKRKNRILSFKKTLSDNEYNKLNNDYKCIFGVEKDFKKDAQTIIIGIFREIFGTHIVTKKINTKIFKLNDELLKEE